MARFRYKGRGIIRANGYEFPPGVAVEVPDDDTETLRKLRGSPGGNSHPSFEEV